MINYIYEYYTAICAGDIVVGKWIIAIYKIIVEGLKRKEYRFDPKKANKAIEFIEGFCRHCEGELAPGLIKLELWQKAIVSVIFGIVESDGTRVFREVVIVVGRKNGKSLFASAIIAYVAYLDDEYGANIYCLAPKLEQAAKVFDAFYQMILNEEELSNLARKRRSDIYIDESNTTIKPLAFNAKKSDGFNPQLSICDEFASWEGDRGLKQYEVMKSALGARRQPLIVSISTAGYINDGIYDELIKRSTAFLNGSSGERRLLPFLYMVDNPAKWNDLTELKKSNPNIGVSVTEDFFKEEIAIAENSASKRREFLCKYCNIKQNSSLAWMSADLIYPITLDKFKLSDFKSSYCVGGIDLSQTTDLTACSVIIEKYGTLYAFCQFFMPSNKVIELQERDGKPYQLYVQRGLITLSGENYVDYEDCFNWFKMLVEEYEILPLKVGYDRYSSQYLVQAMKTYGFHMDDVYQGENLTPVIHECEGLIKDKTLRLVDNSLLATHFLDVAMKENTETRKVRPIKIESRCHIDGFVSVLDALTVRQKWYEEIGEQLKNAG